MRDSGLGSWTLLELLAFKLLGAAPPLPDRFLSGTYGRERASFSDSRLTRIVARSEVGEGLVTVTAFCRASLTLRGRIDCGGSASSPCASSCEGGSASGVCLRRFRRLMMPSSL